MRPALRAGLVGAATVTALHQLARARAPARAPRMDTLGRRVLARGMLDLGIKPPLGANLQALTLAGDLATNALFFALVGSRLPLLRGLALGAAAGFGAIALPPVLGLGRWPSRRSRDTKRMAFGWYLAGGIAAGLAARRMKRAPERRARESYGSFAIA